MDKEIWQNEYAGAGNDLLLDQWQKLTNKVRWSLDTGGLMDDVYDWDAMELEPSEELVERLREHKEVYMKLAQIAEVLEERINEQVIVD